MNMILAFKPEFVGKILDGTKIHTVRRDPHDRWKAGRKIHFATGVRTKDYNQFDEGVCTARQSISIFCDSREIWIEKEWPHMRQMTADEVTYFAKADGFDSVDAMFDFFKNETGYLKLIHWTEKRY